MDIRKFSTSVVDPSVGPFALEGMINDFENRLLLRMGAVLLERRRLRRRNMGLLRAITLYDCMVQDLLA